MHAIDVIYEDANIIIVNKPPDVGIDGLIDPTVRSLLEQRYPGETLRNVHQLDHATSGCYCLARTPEMARRLSKMFERRKVEKTYLALVQGWVTIDGDENSHHPVLEIHAPITARSKEQGEWWKMCVPTAPTHDESTGRESGGHRGIVQQKSATTHVRVLQRGYLTARAFDIHDDPRRIPTLPSSMTSELIPRGTTDPRYWLAPMDRRNAFDKDEQGDRRVKATLVMLTPLTGRRHQLRVHMQHIGHPIIGDYHYQVPMTPTSRMMLHAWRIGFPMPKYRRCQSSLTSRNGEAGSGVAVEVCDEGTVLTSHEGAANEKREGIFAESPHSFHEFLQAA
ncbi:RNA pseudouridylate synthase domain-containing protein 1 [Actinomortierella ambigua]|nr:RNA pseudouridylate synthase domain-containing protein 1 [Actinomortierella ambigua]